MKLMVMWSPGLAASKDETRFWTAVLAGLGPVVTSHIVSVTLVAAALVLVEVAAGVLVLLLPPGDEQAATVTAAAATAAAASHLRLAAWYLPERPGLTVMVSSRSP